MTSIFLGLIAAVTWGASDFAGGLSSRRIGAFTSVFFAELIGLFFVLTALWFVHEPLPPLHIFLLCMGIGAIGSFSLMLLYKSMASGQMSIATPVSGVVAAVLPVIVGLYTDGSPGPARISGFCFAIAAVWLISKNTNDRIPFFDQLASLRLPILAGLGFGLYFVLINHVTQEATLWPMVASRIGGTIFMFFFVKIGHEKLSPNRDVLWLMIINGVLDSVGNLAFILAGQQGRMDIASVLGSLYPGGTVILAWLFLKEKINLQQRIGIVAALTAIVLLAI